MFGFLRPPRGLRKARQAYARVCQYQRMCYGLRSLPFLSYEGAWLYLFATEANWFPQPDEAAPVCCRLRTHRALANAPEAPLGEFCASVGLLLGAIKLDDDVRDGGLIVAPSTRWLLRKRIADARRFFGALDERFAETVQEHIAAHLEYERQARPRPLEEYAEPTGEAFGYVFGLLQRLAPCQAPGEPLHELGRRIGAAIIAFDCAVDWPRDRRTGNFNPLAGNAERRAALAYCERLLQDAAALCRTFHGDASASATVLASVAHRVAQRHGVDPLLACGEAGAPFAAARRRRAGYAFSDFGLLALGDCACEGLGACCECGSAGAEGGGACCEGPDCGSAGAEGGGCCADFFCLACPDACCDWRQKRKIAKGDNVEEVEVVGQAKPKA